MKLTPVAPFLVDIDEKQFFILVDVLNSEITFPFFKEQFQIKDLDKFKQDVLEALPFKVTPAPDSDVPEKALEALAKATRTRDEVLNV